MTEWYESLLLTDVGKHGVFAHEPFPAGAALICESQCLGCAQRSKATHATDAGVSIGAPVATSSRLSYAGLRCIEAWLSDLNRIAQPLYGSTAGFVFNTEAGTRNFADYTTFTVVSVSGTTCSVSISSGDIRNIMPLGGPPQPGDLLIPASPSCLANKVVARVVSVNITSATTATLTTDQTLTQLMHTSVAHPLTAAPSTYTVSLLRAASEPELFPSVIEPTWMRCTRKTLSVTTVPADGKIVLTRADGSNGTVAWPTTDTLTVRTYYGGDWHTVTPDCLTRVYTEKDGSGWKTTLCMGSTDVLGNALADLLTNGETAITVTYYPADVGSTPTGTPVCTDRCVHCCRDWSNSTWDASDGVATDGSGHVWYCDVRRYYDVDSETWKSPTGIASFLPRCALLGTCDKFAALTDDTYFNVAKHLSPWLRSIYGAANIRKRQLMPGMIYSTYLNWRIARVGHPSLMSLYGGPAITSTSGWHELSEAPQWGVGYVGSAATTTDGSGNVTLNPLYGALTDYAFDLTGEDIDSVADNLPDGAIPTLVSGWKTRKDPLETALGAANDPYNWERRQFHRMAARIKRDTLELQTAKGPAFHPRAFSDIPVIIPAIDLTIEDTWQERTNGRAKVLSTPVSIGGTDYSLLLEWFPVRQDAKAEQIIATATVAAVEALEDGTVAIQVENQEQTSSFQDPGIPQCDCLIKWRGGGRFVQPPDYLKIPSFHHEDKTMGGAGNLTWIGDSVKFSGVSLPAQPLFTDRHFTVTKAQAFGGTAAAGWGDEYAARTFVTSGYWAPVDGLDMGDGYYGGVAASTGEVAGAYSDADTAIACAASVAFCVDSIVKCTRTSELMRVDSNDDAGNITVTRGYGGSTPAALVNADELVLQCVTDASTHVPYTVSTASTRPTLTTGQCWIDPVTNWFHFAEADKGNSVDVAYWVEQLTETSGHCYRTAGVTIGADTIAGYTGSGPFVVTGLSSSYTITLVTIAGTEVTYTAGTPTAAQYSTTTDAGNVVLLFHMSNSGKSGAVTASTGSTAPSPGDVAYLPGYGTGDEYGRRQDMVIIQDEDGQAATAGASLVGATITSYRCAQVAVPTGSDTLTAAQYATETFEALPGGSYLWLVGAGKGYVTTDQVTTMKGTGNEWCVKA